MILQWRTVQKHITPNVICYVDIKTNLEAQVFTFDTGGNSIGNSYRYGMNMEGSCISKGAIVIVYLFTDKIHKK